MIRSQIELQSLLQSWSAMGRNGSSPQAIRRIEFGHLTLQLSFNDDRLAALYWRALKHIASPAAAETDVHIHVLCGDVIGKELPRMGWAPSDFGPKRTVPGWCDEHRSTFLLRTERGVALFDRSNRVGYVWMPSVANLPWWERAAPARWLLDIIAAQNALCTVHAACIGRDDAAVLIAGPGGIGKSSLALACIAGGLGYLGDDYCLLDLRCTPRCHSLYSSAKWNADARIIPGLLTGLPAHSTDRSGEKAIVFVDELKSVSVMRRGNVRAVILPRVSQGTRPRLTRAATEEAVKFIVPSTVAQSEAPIGHVLNTLAALVRQVPAFHFDMPPDPDLCAAHLSDWFEEYAGP